MKSLKSGSFLVALVLLLDGAGCAQVKKAVTKESLGDRVALRISEAEFVEAVLKQSKMKLQDVNAAIEPLDVPLDLKLAWILVHDFADDSHLLQTQAQLFELCSQYATDLQALAKQDLFDVTLKVASLAMESRNELIASDTNYFLLREKFEIQLNDSVTPEKATLIRLTSEKLPSLRSQKTAAVLEQFRTGVAEAIARHPELLKPFSEEKPASEILRASRSRVQKLLQSAKTAIK